jgi:hypothetical protein
MLAPAGLSTVPVGASGPELSYQVPFGIVAQEPSA